MDTNNKTNVHYEGELTGEMVIKEGEETKARSNFLSAFNCLAVKYGVKLPDDIDIDFKKMTINVKTEMKDRKLLAFIAELEKITGQLE